MKIDVLPIGKTDTITIVWIKKNLTRAFPNAKCRIVDGKIPFRDENRGNIIRGLF